MRNLILLIAITIVFTACTKESGEGGTSVIQGQVYKIFTSEIVVDELDSLGNLVSYKTIDTLTVARKEFAFSSNKQDYITKFLGLEEKLDTNFQLWLDCMNGDEEALEKMERYNKTDVVGLEEMYLKLRPYIKNHPNIAIMMDENVCSVCGGDSLVETGKSYHTGASKYDIFYCEGCTSPHIRGKSSTLQTNINVRSSS